MEFHATVQLNGKTATGIRVPDDIVEALGGGKHPAVRVTINGYTYRSSIAAMGGVFLIPVSAEVRGQAGVAAGDAVKVDVEMDTEPRTVTVPPDFAAALAADPAAQATFDKLSYSQQRQHTLSIEGAKTPETRQRRIDKAVGTLRNS
jgi:hypothetical protein